jgi:uncharacterized protein YehS (DUF1456 family)
LTNSDVMRRIRYTFDFDDAQMAALVELGGGQTTPEQVAAWLRRDDDPQLEACSDRQLAIFLNGLIAHRRGRRDGPMPEPERRLTNNLILRKLRIALNLRDEGMLEVLALADFTFSKHELSALFRKPGHRSYRVCQDQMLRNFLQGMAARYRSG